MSSHFTCRQIWEQSKWKKLNCEPVCDSRLSLTSQMGCNCLINPMFVSFYAFSYGLFSLRAISSADLPSLGECLCQKHSLPDQLYFAQDFVCCLSRARHLPWKRLEQYHLPRLSAMLLQSHWSPFQSSCLLQCFMINAAPAFSSARRLVKTFFSTKESQKCHVIFSGSTHPH